jgi:hypothetical protein
MDYNAVSEKLDRTVSAPTFSGRKNLTPEEIEVILAAESRGLFLMHDDSADDDILVDLENSRFMTAYTTYDGGLELTLWDDNGNDFLRENTPDLNEYLDKVEARLLRLWELYSL